MNKKSNTEVVLEILKNEVDGDVSSALQKMTEDYKMTWMYEKGNEIFPTVKNDIKSEIKEVYPIKGRTYDIRNIAENGDVVFIEVIECYPDPDSGKMYRTPQVIILELEGEKIRTGRHYCDPRLSFKDLSEEQINKVLDRTPAKMFID